jgi:SAM-dependent methyltransferase/uncharacterized protein YbaR (Trm112 family)
MQPCQTLPEEDHLAALPQGVRDELACPVCRALLELAADGLACSNDRCNAKFAAVDGIPILINQQQSLFDAATFVRKAPTFFKPVGRLRRWLSNSIPTLSANVTARANFRQFRDQLRRRAGRPRVLVIGGSIVGDGLESLVGDPSIELLETDVALGPRTQLICDAHDIPFRDETFDGVILQAVLEHVVDPARCIEEVYRVLRPGGLVYADTPFMQQVHGREFDFTRFTRLGHRRLFRRFRELASGITCGPGVALAWSARYFLLSFFSGSWSRAVVSGFSRLAFFWLKYFDYYLVCRPAALDAASGFYFLGEKSRQVFSDRELIQSYRGGFY